MTTFFIAYSDIPKASVRHINAQNFASTDNENASFPMANCIDGERHSIFKTDQAGGNQYCTYDLGPTNKKAASFMAIARADQIVPTTGNLTVRLRYSADLSSYSNATETTNFELLTLVGPDAQDYIKTFTATSTYRYWQMQLVYSAGALHGNFSKLFFGTLLDLGQDPEDYEPSKVYSDNTFIADDGTAHLYRTYPPLIQVRLRWEGITEAAVESFNSYIAERRRSSTFFLYASSYTDVLQGNSLLHCKCTSAETSNDEGKVDSNTIEATFVEVKG